MWMVASYARLSSGVLILMVLCDELLCSNMGCICGLLFFRANRRPELLE